MWSGQPTRRKTLRREFSVFYSQILPRVGFPAGANDYDNSTTRILSAVSADGLNWTPDPGRELSAEQGGAGEFRVVSSEVVPMAGDTGRFACSSSVVQAQSVPGAIRRPSRTRRRDLESRAG
ncbi:MAG: hypothetical protein Ct9H300mP1_16520 [Planctomycetaceae bacterium]|nr:MAG: hypothetical protein Ct9H300mP1_16520 [Planctomycetaceae bacterium]